MKKYRITYQHYPFSQWPKEEVILETDRIEWSIDQYQRNRLPMEIHKVEEI